MTDPFDTGIRLTVVRDPTRVRCDVDEFVLCPTNARADEAITARDEWQRLAQAEAWDHLVTRKQLVEVEVEVASLSTALGRANHLAWEARQEHDAAVQRAAQAEHLYAEVESDLARLSVRLVESEARDAEARRVWQTEGKAPAGICPYCVSTVSVVQRDEWYVELARARRRSVLPSTQGTLHALERELAERAHCTGCGVRLGDAQCGACAGRATVERIVAWLREEATLKEIEDNNEDAEQSRRTAHAIEAGAWRGEAAP